MPSTSEHFSTSEKRSGYGAAEEPLSLRRLRESLSNLEQLERQRHELRDRFESCPGGISGSDRTRFGEETRYETRSTRDETPQEGSRIGQYSRISSVSPRWGSSSPPPHNLGLGNRCFSSGTDRLTGGVGSGASLLESSPRQEAPWKSSPPAAAGGGSDREATRSSLRAASPMASNRLSSTTLRPPVRDSALALALERSQDHIDALQRERDDALRRAADQESEVLRLTMLVERSEAGHCALLEERQRDAADTQRLRREHREAMEQLTALRAEAHHLRTSSDENKSRLERTVAEQRHQIESLEDSGAHAERELSERSSRTSDTETALFSCLMERTTLLQFMVDLLTALQTLFYDPTPFTKLHLESSSPTRATVAGGAGNRNGSRPRTASVERRGRSGCYACTPSNRVESGAGIAAWPGAGDFPQGSGFDDLRELCSALESEIASASQAFSSQVSRVVAEAEQSARAMGASSPQPQHQQQLRTCAAWLEQERRRRERQGLPPDHAVPAVDWNEERAQYQVFTRSMETKFAQLAKLRRLLQARYNAASKKKAQSVGRY
mmetsp:Transcript_5500/g.10348  ORF Transcript_5500/g.10348 Transcript_5500/m.10348 type:complete len:555 (+) Transcript_5500:99-1763(+)